MSSTVKNNLEPMIGREENKGLVNIYLRENPTSKTKRVLETTANLYNYFYGY